MKELMTMATAAATLMIGLAASAFQGKPENPFASQQVITEGIDALEDALTTKDIERITTSFDSLASQLEETDRAREADLRKLEGLIEEARLVHHEEGVGTLDVEKVPSDSPLANVRNLDDLVEQVVRIDKEVQELKRKNATVSGGTYSNAPTGSSGGSSGGTRNTVSSTGFNGAWYNTDGYTPRQHQVLQHGFDASLTDAELAAQHDAYHNAFGGSNPGLASTKGRTVLRTTNVVCGPDGCPPKRSRTVLRRSNGGLFGLGILGRR